MSLSGLLISDHWERMLRRLGEDDNHEGKFNRLISQYQNPIRKYHGLRHLEDVLEAAEQLSTELKIDPASRGAIALSVFYHDVIYSPLSHENEIKSVEYLIADMTSLNLPLALSAATLGILGTIPGHQPQGRMAKIVSDSDLLVLTLPWDQYRDYATRVREEYMQFYDVEEYDLGRVEALRGLINGELFHFIAGEENAKANMRAEIELIERKYR